MPSTETQTLYGLSELVKRWTVSRDSLWRAAENGDLKTIYVGARRLVPFDEVQRVEREGLGRKRRTAVEAR